jgi:ATP-dependent Lon protease
MPWRGGGGPRRTKGPGSGVHILNRPAPLAFTESVRYAEANLDARSGELIGDRNPREHEFSVRAFVTNLV